MIPIDPKIQPKYYWLVKPECYRLLNKTLKALYTTNDINFFIKSNPKGIYITYDDQIVSDYHKWGHMPYPKYKTGYASKNKFSKKWLKKWGFKYQGEISRKSKLQKINKINESKM